jgi:hypothetical protein
MQKRRTTRKQAPVANQLELDFLAPASTAASVDESRAVRVTRRGRDIRFWPGFMGERAPAPAHGELPLNTKRAAHYLRRSSRWLELVRHEPNSPPWRKVGGLFEYYPTQLDWWRARIADL